jgi:hypothetical protein
MLALILRLAIQGPNGLSVVNSCPEGYHLMTRGNPGYSELPLLLSLVR